MMWVAWRQHRRQALVTLIGLAVLAAVLVPTGLAIRGRFAELGLPQCLRQDTETGECVRAFNQFNSQHDTALLVGILFLVLPLLVGLFWGAPLVSREVEQGTHRFVWTQGVSRTRWAATKFGLVGALTLGAAVAYGLGMAWWLSPLVAGGGRSRFDVLFFDMQGVAPIGYTLFAVALGVFAGTVWPRMLPAMAVTLAGFAAVRVALTVLARPHYLPGREHATPLVSAAGPDETALRGAWTISNGIRDGSGAMVAPGAQIMCPPGATAPTGGPCGGEFGAGAYNWVLYQPADRYWLFQGIETGVFVALAAILLYLAVWRVRRIA
ncbi:ABC-2 transporter permease [Micromonospora andamanensis]|uniref:ABC transporter permease subunit n=1 Tax=Micromonospora andamanensis TaxID=1287068 RepID=UPI0019526A58|nr:ABC transporter permease subunit [Micromonospora andamanensis]GIJ38713.1 transporter [Micromonospora andamanensis]